MCPAVWSPPGRGNRLIGVGQHVRAPAWWCPDHNGLSSICFIRPAFSSWGRRPVMRSLPDRLTNTVAAIAEVDDERVLTISEITNSRFFDRFPIADECASLPG